MESRTCLFCGSEKNILTFLGIEYICKECVKELGLSDLSYSDTEQQTIDNIKKNKYIEYVDKQLYCNEQSLIYLCNNYNTPKKNVSDIYSKFITEDKVETFIKTDKHYYTLYSTFTDKLKVDFVKVHK